MCQVQKTALILAIFGKEKKFHPQGVNYSISVNLYLDGSVNFHTDTNFKDL